MSQVDRLKEEKILRACRKNFKDFFEYVFSWQEPKPIKIQPFQLDWHKKIESSDRTLILAPRDHGKTSQISIARPIFDLGQNPNLRIKIISQSDDKSQDILQAIITHLENNERLKKVFPNLRPADKGAWTKHKIFVQRDRILKDASLESFGIISSGTGGRADKIYFDDVVDYRNAILQPSLRKVVVESFFSVWLNLLEEDGRAIYIATVWHKDDLTNALLKNAQWSPPLVQAIPDDFTPLWPDKWSRERLIQRRNDIGEDEFNRNFRNRIRKQADTIFTEEKILPNMIPDFQVKKEWQYYSGLDPAIGHNRQASNTVLFTVAQDNNGARYEVDIQRGRYSSVDTARLLIESYENYKQEAIFVENNAYQEAIIQWTIESGGAQLPIYSFRTGIQKVDLNIGLPSLGLELEKKLWRIKDLDHSLTCQCPHCVWLRTLRNWPEGGETDTVMAWWLASRAMRMNSREPGLRWI